MSDPLARSMEELVQRAYEEGIRDGARRVMIRLVCRKFGSLLVLLTPMFRLGTADLLDLAEALLDFASQDDLARWLAARG